MTKKLRGTHTGITWLAGAWADRRFPDPGLRYRCPRAWRPVFVTNGEWSMPAASLRDPEANRAKTGKTAIQDCGNFSC